MAFSLRQLLRTTANAVLIGGVLVLGTLPLLRLGADPWVDAQENRPPAPAPTRAHDLAGLAALPARFEAFFNDRFGGRAWMVAARAMIDVSLFDISSNPILTIGRNHWLFLMTEHSLDDFMGLHRVDDAGIAAWWQSIKQRHDQLAARHIPFFFLVAPNKQSIYPELMPPGMIAGRQTDLDRLLEYAAAHGKPDWLVDVRPAMRAAKGSLPLFHPVDVHWNDWGAYVAYRHLAEVLQHQGIAMRLVDLPAADFEPALQSQGDLVNMMGLAENTRSLGTARYAGHDLACIGRNGSVQHGPRMEGENFLWREVDWACGQAAGTPVTLVLHDSMMQAMGPYVAASFSSTLFLPDQVHAVDVVQQAVEKHAQLVIEQMIERNLNQVPPLPPEISEGVAPPASSGGWVSQKTEKQPGTIEIEGWAFWQPQAGRTALQYRTNLPVQSVDLNVTMRADVVADKHDDRLKWSGFYLTLNLRPGAPIPAKPELCLWSEDPSYGAHRLQFTGADPLNSCP